MAPRTAPPAPLQAHVPGFGRFGGLHCETSALQKVLAWQGVEVEEEVLFGLAGGIGFVFWQDARAPLPFVGGRNGRFPDFLRTAGARLGGGAEVEVVATASPRRAWENLGAELRAGRPAVCYGDIRHLPYFHTDRHFGGHAFVVYAVDEAEDRVLVSDRGLHPRTLRPVELERARGSAQPPFPPRNAQLRVRAPAGEIPAASFREAVLHACRALEEPPIRNLGLPGMQRLAAHLDEAVRSAPAPRLLELLAATYVNLELAGTGGCAFRRMYGRFLHRVDERAGPLPPEAHGALDRSVAAWERLVDALLPPVGPATAGLRRLLDEKERTFETGTMDDLRRGGERLRAAGGAWRDAADELDRRRGELPPFAGLLEEIRRAEGEMCRALRAGAGG